MYRSAQSFTSACNFPLAIFTGQVAELVARNSVVTKPAEETPNIAYEGVKILYRPVFGALPYNMRLAVVALALRWLRHRRQLV